jgi:hypothetical protein
MLVCRQVILVPMLLGNTVGMRSKIVQFGGSLVVLIM